MGTGSFNLQKNDGLMSENIKIKTTGKIVNGSDTGRRVSRSVGLQEVFDIVRKETPISRVRLAEMVSVSRAALSSIVSEYIQAGILEETGKEEAAEGRPPIRLCFKPDARVTVGVVQYDTELRATVIDLNGSPIKTIAIPFYPLQTDAMIGAIASLVEQVLAGLDRSRVLGVGVGVPGVVDVATGIFEKSVSKGWLQSGIPIRSILQERLNLPVYVVNRSRVAALGEQRSGNGRGFNNLVYLFMGDGVIAGIVINGELFLGAHSGAGEIGHVSIAPDGPLCNCGGLGCLEMYTSRNAILATARAMARENSASRLYQMVAGRLDLLEIDQVIEAAREGDSTTLRILNDVGTKIGYALSFLIMLYDPEVIILGGPFGSQAGDLLLGPVRREAQRRSPSRAFPQIEILPGALGTEAATIGAGVLALSMTPVDMILHGDVQPPPGE
jgi:glucokinase-like ROK family protein